jgi:hypothetical protein
MSGTITISSADLLSAIKQQLLQMPEITQQPYSYVVYTDGSKYYAKNGSTGQIDYIGTDASTVLQSVLDAVSNQKRSVIYIAEGIYKMSRGVTIHSNVYIKGSLSAPNFLTYPPNMWTTGTVLDVRNASKNEKIFYVDTTNFNYQNFNKVRIENILVYGDNNGDWRGIGFWCDGNETSRGFDSVELINFNTERTAGGLLLRNSTQALIDRCFFHGANPGIDTSTLPNSSESIYANVYIENLIEDSRITQLQACCMPTNQKSVGVRIRTLNRSVIDRISVYNISKGIGILMDFIRSSKIGILEANDMTTYATVGQSIVASFQEGTKIDSILIYNQDRDSSFIWTFDGATVPVDLLYIYDGLGTGLGALIQKKLVIRHAVLNGTSGTPYLYSWTPIPVIHDLTKNTVTGLKNSGIAIISPGTTSVTVNHGLPYAPSKVIVTPTSNVGSIWVSNITSTQFTINCSIAPLTDTTVYWYAEV